MTAWSPPEDRLAPMAWAALLRVDIGSAVALRVEAWEGLEPETEGPNKGPWLRSVLRGGDGLPWCADLLMGAMRDVGAPLPPPFRSGASRYWHNRSVDNMENAYRVGGLWAGPAVRPRRGWLVFHQGRSGSDKGSGRHVDICLDYDSGERLLTVLGGNVGDGVRRRWFRHGHPSITGFGIIGPSLTDLRRGALEH